MAHKKNGKPKNAMRKNILREILRTKSRFFAIFAIIGISVGFFSGLKSASPSMLKTSLSYLRDYSLMDIRIISTVGFDDEDIRNLSELDYVDSVMPGYMSDLIVTQNEIDSVVRVYSVPQKTDTNEKPVNELILREGRLPQKEGECAIENYFLEMSGYHLGDTITFNPMADGKPVSDYVKHSEYKIVGLVDSPLYLTYLRGNSLIGDGNVAFYMMIPPEEFVSERYTVTYLKTKASRDTDFPFGDEYKDEIKAEKTSLADFSEQSIKRFNSTTLFDAKKQLDDGKKEYRKKSEEALKKISDGEKELMDGENELYKKLAEAKKKLDDGEKELADAKEKLTQGQEDYKNGIEEAKKKLTDAQTQYDKGLAEYKAAKLEYDTKIDEAEKKLSAAKTEFDIQYQIFYSSTKPQAETKLTLLKTAIDLCNEIIEKAQTRLDELKEKALTGEVLQSEIEELEKKLEENRDKLSEYRRQYDEGTKQLAEGEEKLNDAKKQLESSQQELQKQKAEGALKLSEAEAQLDSAQGQLANGKLEYETAMTSGILELQAAQTKISEGEKQLEKGRAELEEQTQSGLFKLKAAREKLAEGKYEAHVQLSEAEEKLSDAEEKIGALENAEWYIYDRDDNPGYSGLYDDSNRVNDIAKVFPVFFLLVAGLVCFTTMTRMVEERRTETGTLKALGYSNVSIAAKYVVYSGTAAFAGAIAGSAAGVLTLPRIIVDTYRIMYTFPPTQIEVDWKSLILSSLVGILFIMAVSFAACFKDLRLAPATLMRPKAPKPGKRILLEHVRPLWNHMNFTSKVTARNLFRYKARFFMTVIGVAGCTALMVAGFGLKDSVSGIAGRQFDELTVYDQVYSLSESGSAEQKAYLMSRFHKDERFENSLLTYMGWGFIQSEDGGKNPPIRMVAGSDPEEFKNMFILRDRKTHSEIPLTDEGIVISERLSEVLKISAGDNVVLTLEDKEYTCKVTGFTENYAGSIGYMTPAFYEKLTGSGIKYSVVVTRIAEDFRGKEHDIANEYMKDEDIITVTSITEQVSTMLNMIQSLDIIILVLIICAGLLAVVVLYNLTNINIGERVREIATIKVLGFYSLETANFIYREIITLTVIGAVAGLGLGNIFATFVVESIQMDNVMFPKYISFWGYFISFALTIAFSLIVNFIMYFKMNKISMVESLKSIE